MKFTKVGALAAIAVLAFSACGTSGATGGSAAPGGAAASPPREPLGSASAMEATCGFSGTCSSA